jgi:hypothetical protein
MQSVYGLSKDECISHHFFISQQNLNPVVGPYLSSAWHKATASPHPSSVLLPPKQPPEGTLSYVHFPAPPIRKTRRKEGCKLGSTSCRLPDETKWISSAQAMIARDSGCSFCEGSRPLAPRKIGSGKSRFRSTPPALPRLRRAKPSGLTLGTRKRCISSTKRRARSSDLYEAHSHSARASRSCLGRRQCHEAQSHSR